MSFVFITGNYIFVFSEGSFKTFFSCKSRRKYTLHFPITFKNTDTNAEGLLHCGVNQRLFELNANVYDQHQTSSNPTPACRPTSISSQMTGVGLAQQQRTAHGEDLVGIQWHSSCRDCSRGGVATSSGIISPSSYIASFPVP